MDDLKKRLAKPASTPSVQADDSFQLTPEDIAAIRTRFKSAYDGCGYGEQLWQRIEQDIANLEEHLRNQDTEIVGVAAHLATRYNKHADMEAALGDLAHLLEMLQ